jgi:CO/xanthine dehydrogenase Mo-binding subunit
VTTGDPIAMGVSRPRPDGPAKVRGATRYGADRPVPGLLHARLVLATRAHARLVSIDRSAALAAPGVVTVLVASDLPISSDDADRMARPLASGEILFSGHPVAMVVATTPAAAADAAELVVVREEPLPVVVDPVAAMDPGSPLARLEAQAEAGDGAPAVTAQAHAAVGGGGDSSIDDEILSPNVIGRFAYREGDPGRAIDRAAVSVGGRFRCPWVHQGYLEPQVSTARLDDEGNLLVETSTQSIFGTRSDLARVLGLPDHRIRVSGTPIGGAFGGKYSMFESLVASAALTLRRPVRLALDRSTDFRITNPSQSFDIEVRLGADGEGRFVGLEVRIVADAGAFEDGSGESLAGVLVAGPYRWPAYDIRAYGVRTNRFGVGPYRGPTGGPTAFALETLIDELAGRLGLDPIDVRETNAVAGEGRMVDGEPWPPTGIHEVLAAVRNVPEWGDRAATRMAGDVAGGEAVGTGVAVACWPGAMAPAAALCRASPDGTIQIVTGVADMSGTFGGFQAIAAEVLGLAPESVSIAAVDTGSAPRGPGSGGSMITYSVGRAIRLAAEAVRERILDAAALQLEIAIEDLELVDGTVRPRGTPERAIPLGRLVRQNARDGGAPIEALGSSAQPSLAPTVAAHVVSVAVDRGTGEVRVLADHVVQDVGRAVNPGLITDQQHGGAAQGLGMALREALVHDVNGQLLTGTLLDYALPRIQDLGHLATTIVEVPAPDGPFGAKGVGEIPALAAAAAVANAIADAVGVRLREMPMTAPRVRAALVSR